MGDLITGIDFRRHLDKPKPEKANFPGGIDDLPTIFIIDWDDRLTNAFQYLGSEKDPA